MKKFFLFFALMIGVNETFAQNYDNWAVGVKVGEPIGVNVRKYFKEGTRNFDINFGTYGLLWGGTRKYQNGYYYDGSTGVMLQGIYHWNVQLGSAERLQFYYGVGGQINSRKRPLEVGNNVAHSDLSIGGVGNVGLEYSLPNNNLSVFTDWGLYMELLKKPGFVALPASIGVRLNILK